MEIRTWQDVAFDPSCASMDRVREDRRHCRIQRSRPLAQPGAKERSKPRGVEGQTGLLVSSGIAGRGLGYAFRPRPLALEEPTQFLDDRWPQRGRQLLVPSAFGAGTAYA